MNKDITYSTLGSNIDNRIKRKHIIPYSIFPGEKYKKGKWYFNRYDNMFFKVLDVTYTNGNLEEVYIKTDEGNYCSIATDLSDEDLLVEKDKNNIYKLPTLFNSNISYTGAEITYWFFMHDINCMNKEYSNFWKFVDRYSLDRLDEKTKYFLYCTRNKWGNIKSVRIKEDITDITANREKANIEYHNKDLKFLKKDKQKHIKKSSRE